MRVAVIIPLSDRRGQIAENSVYFDRGRKHTNRGRGRRGTTFAARAKVLQYGHVARIVYNFETIISTVIIYLAFFYPHAHYSTHGSPTILSNDNNKTILS